MARDSEFGLYLDAGDGDEVLLPNKYVPPGTQIDALHRLIGGDWLVSLESATTIGATTYDPRDVFRTNGIAASLVFCGAAAGVP